MAKNKEDKGQVERIRHSLAHLMAIAVLDMFPKAKLGIGPVIENGFYYDFDLPEKLISDQLPKLEKRIREFIKKDLTFKKTSITVNEGRKMFKDQPYKLELINELYKNKQPLTIYTTFKQTEEYPSFECQSEDCKFHDLCGGSHVDSTKEINPDAFKLTKVAGAYWKGDEKNKMLVRIYGVAFATKEELNDYLKMMEEAEKRDHRKLGKELDLFSFHEQGPGFPFWHPKGVILYNELKDFIREENIKRDYGEVMTPLILNKNLWLTSGHWEKFKENMYFTEIDKQEFAVKPMNCPGGLLIYNETLHSYRDLPVRYSEFGLVHRHELSGVLHGLFRVRSFTQDDAHSFCAPEQLNSEIDQMIDYALDVYKTFGFKEYSVFIATKPEKYIGEDKIWEKATNALIETLKSKKLEYKIKEGEGAFYGPKIEFDIKDAIGRDWQMGTVQIDFSMPERFGAVYITKDGSKKTLVMVHRAILGSLERFIGVLIEHYAGLFPLWLSPVQVLVLPVGEGFNAYAEKVLSALENVGIRAEIDKSDETLGKKIRSGKTQKIPYILVVGEKEEKEKTVSVNARDKKEQEILPLQKFTEKILKEIADKK